MVPKPAATAKNAAKAAPKLPPLPALRVRNANAKKPNPCIALMSSVLSCWASTNYSIEGCGNLEQQLRSCMDNAKPPKHGRGNINDLLSRFYPRIKPPVKYHNRPNK